MYVSPLAYLKNPHVQFHRTFLYVLSMVATWSPLMTVHTLYYVLPVLWMASCFHIMVLVGQNQRWRYASSSSPDGGTRGVKLLSMTALINVHGVTTPWTFIKAVRVTLTSQQANNSWADSCRWQNNTVLMNWRHTRSGHNTGEGQTHKDFHYLFQTYFSNVLPWYKMLKMGWFGVVRLTQVHWK